MKEAAFGTDELDREKKHLQEEMNVVAELIQQCRLAFINAWTLSKT